MGAFSAGQRPRRLPIFFLLDTSNEMDGTLQVTMQDGIQVIKSELIHHALAAQHVYCGGFLFGEDVREFRLVPLEVFHIPGWEARGTCQLQPALVKLSDALMFDVIAPHAGVTGDYKPLVFLVLGGEPTDAETWQEVVGTLATEEQAVRPLIVALVTRTELVEAAKHVSEHVLVLAKEEGLYMTAFFFWVAQVIAKISENCERGITEIEFPVPPYGVMMPR